MNRQINIGGKKISYKLRHAKRSRSMRLSIYTNGSFIATIPRNCSIRQVENFILKKSEWVLAQLAHAEKFKDLLIHKNDPGLYAAHKEQARAIASERIAHFNTRYGFNFGSVRIKQQKNSWGSCSKKGNLNFNYKIALLPPELADYVIVHELCHLQEFNHSKKFWDLVALTIPDFKARKKALYSR